MKLNRLCTQFAACTALVMAASAAHADTYNFTLTGSATASWQMDSSPPVFNSSDYGFEVAPQITGTFYGASGTAFIYVYSYYGQGGLWINRISNGADIDLQSRNFQQIYEYGSDPAPIIVPGTYALLDRHGTGTYSLTISAVPEPATLALMLSGLGLVGYTASRRRAS